MIPAIVLENRGIGESFGRSRELVRGNGWNVFGVIVLTFLILLGVGIVVGLVLSPIEQWLASLIQQFVSTTIVTPFIATSGRSSTIGSRRARTRRARPLPSPSPPPSRRPPPCRLRADDRPRPDDRGRIDEPARC